MIYLDYNATTPVDKRVLDRMLPYFTEHFGNPSSAGHSKGWTADAAVKRAAEQLAGLLGGAPDDFVFTSGATEAINYAIKGFARTHPAGAHLVTVETEHKAVLDTIVSLEAEGYPSTVVGVNADGSLDLEELASVIRDETVLVAAMWANNEIGTVHPIPSLSKLLHERGVKLFVDATQAVGKLPVSVDGIDMLACSAHKFYGPKGVGALYARRGRDGVRLQRLIDGGGQQRSRRGGTLNVPAIVGMGEAAEVAGKELTDSIARLSSLRDYFESTVVSECEAARVNAAGVARLPQTSSITYSGVSTTDMLLRLRDVAVSTASACQSGAGEPSHVLTAIGLSPEEAECTFRVSLGRPTTGEEVERAAAMFVDAYASVLRKHPKPIA